MEKASGKDVVKMSDEAVIGLMIEKRSAVENLEEILSVKGVDFVQFGPSDYSMSIGIPDQTSDDRVRKAELKTINTALDMNINPRVEINEPQEAKKYIELGVKDFNLNIDLFILSNWWKKKGSELNQILEKT